MRNTYSTFTRRKSIQIAFLLWGGLMLFAPSSGEAAYEVSWYTIDGGGGTSSRGSYTIKGTIGQPDAGVMSGGDYELVGGFLPGGPVCIVDFYHFSLLAEHWLEEPCNAGNNWCGGADLDQLGDVDFNDVDLFVEEWLYYCPLDWPLK